MKTKNYLINSFRILSRVSFSPSLIALAGLLCLGPRAFGITRTWIGGVSGYWNDGGNWSPNGAPQAGDDLVFNNSPGALLTNNILGLSVSSIQFNHTCTVYDLGPGQDLTVTSAINAASVDSGLLALNLNTLTLGGDLLISANDTAGTGLRVNCPVHLNGHNLTVSAANNATGVQLNSRIFNYIASGGNLTFTGGSNLMQNSLSQPNTNQFSGIVTVTGGSLTLSGSNQPIVPGNLVIGPGSSSNPPEVIVQTDKAVGGGTVTVNANSLLQITNASLSVSQLNLNDGGSVIGGYLHLSGGATVAVGSLSPGGSHVSSSINGILLFPANDNVNFFVTPYALLPPHDIRPELDVPASISIDMAEQTNIAPAGFVKDGLGQMQLSGINVFQGAATIYNGTLVAASSTALGTSPGVGTFVNNGASLALEGGTNSRIAINNEPLYLNSSNAVALDCRSGSNFWGSTITLSQPATVNVNSGYLQTLGRISGSGGLTKTGNGSLQFFQNTANTYSGVTTVSSGMLQAGGAGVVTLPGDVVVGDDTNSPSSAVLRTGSNQQLNSAANLTVHKSGFLDTHPFPGVSAVTTTVATLSGGGEVSLFVTNSTLTVNNTNFCSFSGQMAGYGTFIKLGSGTMQMTGTNALFGPTLVNGGSLQMDGSQVLSSFSVTFATLQGTGVTGPINLNSGGTVSPGDSPGILTCGNFTAALSGNPALQIELNGPSPGSGYDQLKVVGAVNLGTNLNLNATLNYAPSLNDTFTIINNAGTNPVVGAFKNLPEGAMLTIGSEQYHITYVGGDGNDVVLTHVLPTLDLTVGAGGIVLKNPDLSVYPYYSTVTLTAIPLLGYAFSGWSFAASGTQNPLTLTMNGPKVISASFTNTLANPFLIVDNTNANATFTGSWTTDSGSVGSGFYGPDFRYATTAGSSSATATFRPNLPLTGNYDVYVWFPQMIQNTKRCTDAEYVISSPSSGTNLVSVDQHTANFGFWLLIASGRKFPQGTNAFVQLSNQSADTGKYVGADAVAWSWSINQPPLPFITSVTATRTNTTLTWLSGSNFFYRLQYKTSLVDSAWLDVSGDVTATNASASKTDNTLGGAATRFYRVTLFP